MIPLPDWMKDTVQLGFQMITRGIGEPHSRHGKRCRTMRFIEPARRRRAEEGAESSRFHQLPRDFTLTATWKAEVRPLETELITQVTHAALDLIARLLLGHSPQQCVGVTVPLDADAPRHQVAGVFPAQHTVRWQTDFQPLCKVLYHRITILLAQSRNSTLDA